MQVIPARLIQPWPHKLDVEVGSQLGGRGGRAPLHSAQHLFEARWRNDTDNSGVFATEVAKSVRRASRNANDITLLRLEARLADDKFQPAIQHIKPFVSIVMDMEWRPRHG